MDCSLPEGFPGKNTGVGCHFLLQGLFPTQGLNLGLPHCRQRLYALSHQGRHGPWRNSDWPSPQGAIIKIYSANPQQISGHNDLYNEPFMGILFSPGGSDSKESNTCNVGDLGSVPGWEVPLDGGEHANHSSILAWRIPWTEEPVGYSPWSQSVVHDWATNTQHIQLFINTEQSIYIFRSFF